MRRALPITRPQEHCVAQLQVLQQLVSQTTQRLSHATCAAEEPQGWSIPSAAAAAPWAATAGLEPTPTEQPHAVPKTTESDWQRVRSQTPLEQTRTPPEQHGGLVRQLQLLQQLLPQQTQRYSQLSQKGVDSQGSTEDGVHGLGSGRLWRRARFPRLWLASCVLRQPVGV